MITTEIACDTCGRAVKLWACVPLAELYRRSNFGVDGQSDICPDCLERLRLNEHREMVEASTP